MGQQYSNHSYRGVARHLGNEPTAFTKRNAHHRFLRFSLLLVALSFLLASCGTKKALPKENTPVSTKEWTTEKKTRHYVEMYAPTAVAEMKKHQIPASITLAPRHFGIRYGAKHLSPKSQQSLWHKMS